MNIACTSCPAKYGVPDEKVRGRKVRITCKRCGAAIIVDGTQAGALDPAPEAAEPAGDRARQRTILGGLAAPVDSAPGAPRSQPPPALNAAVEASVPVIPKAAAPAAAAAIPKPAVAATIPKPGAATTSPKPVAGSAIPKPGGAGGFPRPGGLAGSPALAAAAAAKPGGVALPKVQAKPAGASAKPAGATATPAPTAGASATATPAPIARTSPAGAATPARAAMDVPWTVAVTDDDHRDMPTAQVVEAYAAHTVDAETFIWRDGMDDWLTPFEIPEIAAALAARGLTPRTNDAQGPENAAPAADEPRPRQPSGSWREPGKWDQGPFGEPTFDDVTVAMAAPKAQELLEAVADSDSAARAAHAPDEEEPKARPAPRPAAGAPAPAAVRPPPPREEKRDLFARAPEEHEEPAPRARMPSIPPEPQGPQGSLTGVRNESSVLFSLDQLTGGPVKAKARATREAKPEKVDAEALMFGGNGSSSDDAPPSVANLGGGALFNAAAMAAPDFTTAPAPSAPIHATPSSAPPVGAPTKKSGGGLWVALAAVAVVAGGGALFFGLRPTPRAPAPEVTTPVVAAPAIPPAPAAAPTAQATAASPPASAATAAAAASGATPVPPASSAPLAAPGAPPAGPAAVTTPPASPAPAGAAPAAAAPAAASPAAAAPGAGTIAAAATPKPAAAPGAPAAPKPEAPAASADGPEFDKGAASQALAAAASGAQGECASVDGPHGTGKVTITFVNSGRATNALVSGDFAGSALGGCVARVFRGAKVPAFSGDSVRVTKTVHIP